MMRITCAAVALILATSASASADAPPNYVGLMGSYVLPDSARGTDDGAGFHILYGSPMSRRLSLELNVFGQRTDLSDGSGRDAGYGVGLDLRYLRGSPRLGWFVLGGLGSFWEDYGTDEELSPYLDAGIGAQAGGNSLQLRAEARYYAIFNNDTYAGADVLYDARLNLGLLYSFGAAQEKPLRRFGEIDDDHDGVVDTQDDCPGTPFGTPVDARGCPLQAVTAIGDSDGDGVLDTQDQCPGTAAGVAVDAAGCPLDQDGDGIPNAEDACPDTPPGFKVDITGCVSEAQTVTVLKSVHFEFASAKLTRDARVVLDRVAIGLRSQPDLRLEIIGNTDAQGSDAYNQQLSLARAASVRNYLIDRGIPGNRLEAVGHGKRNPIADNDTEEGRGLNRRVEFRVLTE
ncbi:OmpA family protein [Fontimonas sp. SYSU GA230001]|uniref:OmpA family protein n=1 Tax=Fontimonas sp. SYSU GA230001 TaxID=3142450 RepID=UPI0032B3F030